MLTEKTKNIIMFFFLILFCNSVFAQGIDYSKTADTIYFSETVQEKKVVFDRGDGCSTVELPESAINALWKEILTKGFSADIIKSDQGANNNRSTLDQNSILLTTSDSKEGDLVLKEEIPSKIINPLEVPTLLGQSCTGPYEFGVNLEDTLRIGRCVGKDADSQCFLEGIGAYRQNDMTGFFSEVKSVTKDAVLGIKEMLIIDGDTNKEKLYQEDLGVFTETSTAELNNYLDMMDANNEKEMSVETWNLAQDKAIKNSTRTHNFSVSMQTTCSGENCYINTYTLFDKMFNQYFSVDMVYSATAPVFFNGMAKIVNHPSINKVAMKPNELLKKAGIKEGGFLDTLTKEPAMFIQDPLGRIKKSIDVGIYSRRDVDAFILSKLDPLQNTMKRDIQNANTQEFVSELLSNTQGTPGDVSKFTLDKIVNDSAKLSATQKRVVTDVAQTFGDRAYSANALLKFQMADPNFISAKNIVDKGVASGLSSNQIYSMLSSSELAAYKDVAYSASRLSDAYDIASFKTYKWKSGFENSALVNNRTYENLDAINLYRSVDGHTSVKLYETGESANKLFTEFDPFRYNKTANGYDLKGVKNLQTQIVPVTLADGSVVNSNRVKAVIEQIDYTNYTKLYSVDDLSTFYQMHPNTHIRYLDSVTGNYVTVRLRDADLQRLSGSAMHGIDAFPRVTNVFVDDYLDPNTGLKLADTYGRGYFDLDTIETMKVVLDNAPKKLDNTARNFNEIYKTLSNKEWVSGSGRDLLNQFARQRNGIGYQRFLTRNLKPFLINFAYWEVKTAGHNLLGDNFGMSKYSMYQLPKSYSAFHITHHETAKIYEDAYVDFFANEGSDQGDLFMQFLNSFVNWANFLGKEIISSVDADWAKTVANGWKKITEGQLRRKTTDDIVLVTNNLEDGCVDKCGYVIGIEYIDKETKDASILAAVEEIGKEKDLEKLKEEIKDGEKKEDTEELPNIISDPEKIKETEEETETNEEEKPDKEKEETKKETKTSGIQGQKFSLNQLTINTLTPAEITTVNYILENTSEKSYTKDGQTLISFSHHTDYDGTISNQTTEKAVNLLNARENYETCEQVLEDLSLIGFNIGGVVPDALKNHRFAAVLIAQQKLSYVVFPTAGKAMTFLTPALTSDIPQMFFIAPQLKDCVDDKEGTYAHIFVSSLESERLSKDSKNKVGETVKKGVEKLEETLTKATEGTELEKGVKYGAEQIKDFAEQKLQEYPIVQATYKTTGTTDTTLFAQLFFFEMGPRSKCKAIGYNDKGVEILEDKDTNISLKIDKDNGEMTVIDANGNLKTIIGGENKDFVRLIATNLAIPAKVVPRSLSYIPIPDNEEPLFEIDSFGNFSIKNSDFFSCLKAGYEAQTGLTIPSNVSSLTDYVGAVKLANTVHPTSNYLVHPLGTEIVAQGVPRFVADGSNAKAVVLGNRKTTISPVDTRAITIGHNVAIEFEYAQLIYVEEKKAYIFWVETTSVTHGNDIDKLKTELIKEKATNGCDETDEIGLNFSVTPERDNDQAKINTDKLNLALEKVGPFQMFDTETKTFIFYVSDPPECEQRLKIIDKKTGEITDSKITSIQQTPTGLLVKTDDGKTHDIGFSAENGIPMINYNGEKETLLSAQGKNGSFWYDPESGNWYTTNGNLIPFNDSFRDGITFTVNPNGETTGTSGNTVFNIGSGGGASGNGGFNIPLIPEKTAGIVLYVSIILMGFIFIYLNKK